MTDAYSLNLRHLRMLPALAQAGSISQAAKLVGVTQPALSQALLKLEGAFGTELFQRHADGISLTQDGAKVLDRVDRSLASLAQAFRFSSNGLRQAEPVRFLTSAHLRGLLTVAEQGSFVAAARAAGVSAPAVHRAVRDLEALAGAPLVVRRGRGIGLSRAGHTFARAFSICLSELNAALDECSARGGRITVGAMALSRSLLLPATLATLLRERPEARVDVVDGSYLELVGLLRSGRIDIIIGALRAQPDSDIRQETLFIDQLTIIGRAEHPLAKKEASFADLACYPWIVARRASGLLERWQQIFDRAGVPRPDAPIQCGSVSLIRGVLVQSDFMTLLSRTQVSAEIEAGLLIQILSCIPDTPRAIGAITRLDWHPTELQERFLAILRQVGTKQVSDRI
ncbi:LysR family transcriptional regulator (plasmid) [Lichenicola cladoniae]|uniref:LysR family transcriptional regulator n=1 Tax=Lichenicola cladoniae TaxID=1484109 RepID=A0A6M8HWX7_9PROT|nr:LysR family transcriptional regulator [Lichenicola cladoniae]NPD68688.1 LysR family transcriptional regulator [Acetobacteraceae bacterium]QKE93069.1 LysR family transcriptional regulator [Lichenicola cladoniae]